MDDDLSDILDDIQAVGNRQSLDPENWASGYLFNPLKIIRPNEVQVSRLLANILSPTGSHGQGTRFLSMFIDSFCNVDQSALKLDQAVVSLEAPCSLVAGEERRRIDVLISMPRFAIAIENKPWAAWQDRQLQCYASELEARGIDKTQVIAFVGGVTDAKAQVLRCWPDAPDNVAYTYAALGAWLDSCRGAIERGAPTPKDLQTFLAEFAEYARWIAEGSKTMSYSPRTLSYLLSDIGAGRLKAAFELEAALPDYRASRAGDIELKFHMWLGDEAKDWTITSSVPSSGRGALKQHGVTLTSPSGLEIAFALFNRLGETGWVGIVNPVPDDFNLVALGVGRSDLNLAWWNFLDGFSDDLGSDADQLWLLSNETLAFKIMRVAISLEQKMHHRDVGLPLKAG